MVASARAVVGPIPTVPYRGHFGIFAGVVMLYGPSKRNSVWLWLLVLGGGILLELVQITVGDLALTKPLLLDSVFDVVVDVAGAAVAVSQCRCPEAIP